MSQRVVGYEGEGRHRKPIYAPEGPASAAASSPVAMLGRLTLPGAPTGGAGPIERRQITEAQRVAHDDAPPVPGVRAGVVLGSGATAEQMQKSRRRGARRHVEVMAARRQQEEAPVIEPVIEDQVDAGPAQSGAENSGYEPASTDPLVWTYSAPPDPPSSFMLDRLSEAAREAATARIMVDTAREALARAETIWEAAQDDLRAAWNNSGMDEPPIGEQLATFTMEIGQLGSVAHDAGVPLQAFQGAVSDAEVRHERLLEEPLARLPADAPDPEAPYPEEQVQAEVEAAWLERAAATENVLNQGLADEPAAASVQTAPEAGGGPGALTVHEQRVLASAIKHRGDRKAVAAELGFRHTQSVDQALEKIARKGQLPASLIPLLPARFAKYRGI